MVVLIRAHEAGEHDLAGQRARVGEDARLGAQDDLAGLADGEAVRILDAHGVARDVQRTHAPVGRDDVAREEVDLADEVRDEFAAGMVVDGFRRAHLRDDAFVHDDDVVGNCHRLRLVVCDVDGGDAQRLLDAADFRAHGDAQLGVEVGERLVKEQHARLHDHRAGERDALLLAAGELVGHALLHAGQLDEIEDARDALLHLRLGHLAQAQAVGDVVVDVVVREERIALEDHRRVALVGRQGVDRLVAQVDFALVRGFKARDHAQRRRLAAAGGAQQRHKAARLDVKRHVMHGVKRLARLGVVVDLGDMVKANALLFLGGHVSPPPLLASVCWFRSA